MEDTFDDIMAKAIGQKIGQWRLENGMTQDGLAKKLGMSRANLSQIESGKHCPSIPQIAKIQLITGIDFSFLFSQERERRVVVDTNVIVNRLQSLRYIADLCDHVHIPRVVIEEINYQKDHSRQNQVRATASRAEGEIHRLLKEGLVSIEETPAGQNGNNDDRIYAVAERLALAHVNSVVYLLTNDKDFNLKGSGSIDNLKVISSDEFDSIFRQDDGFVARDSQAFFRAVKAGDLEEAKRQLERGHVDVNYVDQASGNTPLHQAIEISDRYKRTAMIRFLLTRPRIDVNKCDQGKNEIPPISRAIQKRNRGIVQDLITAGANVNEPSSAKVRNPYNTPLMIAAWQGSLDLVQLLVENGACINQQDRGNGFTALIKAAYRNHADVVRYLLEVGADTTIHSWEKKTALDYNEEMWNGGEGTTIKAMLMGVSR